MTMSWAVGLMLGLLCACPVTPAQAVFFPFGIFENSAGADVSQLDLWVDVLDSGTNLVDFVFGNDSAISATVTDVYFERTDLWEDRLYGPLIINNSGVDFSPGAHPSEPPASIAGTGGLGPWGGTLFAAGAIPPPAHEGIDPGETLTIQFGYDGEFAALISALTYPGEFRIVEKIQNIGYGGESVWGVTPIPEPATSFLLVSGLLLASCARLIRRRSKS